MVQVLVEKTENEVNGLPPWHTVTTVGLLLALFAPMFPSAERIDHDATISCFSKRLFPELVSLEALVAIRATICAIVFASSGYSLLLASTGYPTMVVTPYLPNSKLIRNVQLQLRGLYSQAPFTMVSWNLLGVSFGLNAYLGYQALRGNPDVPTWLLRLALLLFETTAPMTLLIAFVVRYILWPQVLKMKGPNPTAMFKLVRVLMYHNLNVIFALTEISLLGGIPVRYSDFPVALSYGISYVLFSWVIRNHWDPTGRGKAQFIYHFFDTTLGATTTLALLALLVILVAFYGLFCVIHQILDHVGGGIVAHSLSVVLISSLVCRFRD